MGRKVSETALMPIKVAGFSLYSSTTLNHFLNEDNIELAALSASRGSAPFSENYDNFWSRPTKYGSALIVSKLLKSYAVEEL